MNIKVNFDSIEVKEDKNDYSVKVLMLKGEKGDPGDGENNVIEEVQVNGTALPVTNKAVNVNVPIVDSTISSSSTNPVQNKVIKEALDDKVNNSALNNYYQISEVDNLLNSKANTSALNDYYTKIQTYNQTEIDTLLESKASGTDIDTINSVLSTKANSSDVANTYETIVKHNEDIEALTSTIESVASGSPLVASSVSGMTDTTRTYVNTTDGNWYYYDGDSWEIGGTYQAPEDSDTVNELNEIVHDVVNVKVDYLKDITWTQGQISTTDGKTIVTSSTRYHTPLFEIEKKKYVFNKEVVRVFLYDNNEDMLLYTGSVTEYEVTNVNAKYMRVVALDTDYQSLTMFIENAKNEIKLNALPINEIKEEVVDKIVATVGMFDNVGALGDSFTSGAVLKEDGETWVGMRNQSYVATMCKRAGTNWTNYGVGGTSTRTYINQGYLQAVLNDDPQNMYFICFGLNDVSKIGPSYLGTISDINDNDYTQNADTFYGNYGRIIQSLEEHAPKSKLTLIIFPKRGSQYTDFIEAIKNIANHFSIPYIDPFDDDYFISDLYNNTFSSGHPTAVSYVGMGIAYERLFSKCVENNISYFNHANE